MREEPHRQLEQRFCLPRKSIIGQGLWSSLLSAQGKKEKVGLAAATEHGSLATHSGVTPSSLPRVLGLYHRPAVCILNAGVTPSSPRWSGMSTQFDFITQEHSGDPSFPVSSPSAALTRMGSSGNPGLLGLSWRRDLRSCLACFSIRIGEAPGKVGTGPQGT